VIDISQGATCYQSDSNASRADKNWLTSIGEVLGMPTAEAIKLLPWYQWRQGDMALLRVAAARLGLKTKTEGNT